MNGFDSEEAITRKREELEDLLQQAKHLKRQYFWDTALAITAMAGMVAYIGYLVYMAYGG